MAKTRTDTEELRERLTNTLADWGAEMSLVLRQLDAAREEIDEAESSKDAGEQEVSHLQERLKGQSELIETLRQEAGEALALREEGRSKDLEIERLKSEIESKQELVRALRRDAESSDRAKAESRSKDKEIESLRQDLERAEKRAREQAAQLVLLEEQSREEADVESAELAAVRSELEARKTLIRSLRADSERVSSLEHELDSKREIIESLEESMNNQADLIADLRRSAAGWKRKYQSLKGESTGATSVEIPVVTESDVAALQQLEAAVAGGDTDGTVAIDMRRPLSEARRRASDGPRR